MIFLPFTNCLSLTVVKAGTTDPGTNLQTGIVGLDGSLALNEQGCIVGNFQLKFPHTVCFLGHLVDGRVQVNQQLARMGMAHQEWHL